jgi:hypothetical protein
MNTEKPEHYSTKYTMKLLVPLWTDVQNLLSHVYVCKHYQFSIYFYATHI